jgi:hypothetical protein
MTGKKVRKYFPNRIKEIMELPPDIFMDIDFEAVIEKNWHLRPGKEFIIRGMKRAKQMDVVEKSFMSPHHAWNYVCDMSDQDYEITVATNEYVLGFTNSDEREDFEDVF